MLQLYGDLLSQPTRATILLCLANKIEYQLNYLHISKLEHKRPDFLGELLDAPLSVIILQIDKTINPRGQVPVINDDGFSLAESATIMRYLAVTRSVPDHWYPADAKARARVDTLLDWYHTNLRQTARYIFSKELQEVVFNLPPAKKEEVSLYERNMRSSMSVLEEEFLTEEGPFLLGASKPSIADLLLACEVMQTQMLNKADYEAVLGPRPKMKEWLQALESYLAPHFYAVHSKVRETAAFLEKKRSSRL